MLNWIDSHCHLDRYIKDKSLADVIKGAKDANVNQMIAVGTNMTDWPTYCKLVKDHPRIHYSVGLHPCYVEDDWSDQLQLLMPYFSEDTLPCALGEIGLDNFHLPKDPSEIAVIKKRQTDAFRKQLSFAYQLDCPVIIHSRNAFYETVKLIDESGVNWERVVFHCFSEGPDEVAILNQRGGRASFTGIITYKNAEPIRQALIKQGPQLLMLETDAPYLAPTPHRGKENFPAYTSIIGEHAASILGVEDLEAFSNLVSQNTRDFFQLSS